MSNILLIDDDPDFSEALSAELRRAGHLLTCASSCAEGLSALTMMGEEEDLDAVLVDMFMPDVDGFETIHALRDLGVNAPVIAISGGCSTKKLGDVLVWATALGADASIAKPFPIDRLMMLVDSIPPQQKWLC